MSKLDDPELGISRQGKLDRLSRSAFYDTPVGVEADRHCGPGSGGSMALERSGGNCHGKVLAPPAARMPG
ncbi:hypothetical protein [Oceaniglobus trochenteri]|uniref:hypothetical protein n=1 Tax=Oceaniglobus trochenteri TaxID=2763260 RepID=UPI001CFFC198|nr:hypothetical protein [Oceaniglobus trochenteri]